MTQWKADLNMTKGVYTLHFETTDFEKYKAMQKTAQKMMDKAKKEREKARATKMSVLGHL